MTARPRTKRPSSDGRDTRGAGATLDYAGFVDAVVARQGKLSRGMSQIAQFCLNHPEDVALSNIVRLAKLADVAPASITRFSKEFGFSGFAALQAVFRQRLVGPRMTYAERMSALRERPTGETLDLEHPSAVFDTFVQSAMDSLVRLGEEIDRPAIERAVDVLAETDAVHIAAARGAFGIGAYALYGFSNVGKRAHLIDNTGAMRAEQVFAIGDNDALLALTFDDYTPETAEIALAADARGCPVIAITDTELSPIASLGDPALYVREARLGHFRSQVPALVLCQAIIVSLGRRLDNGA